MFVIVTIQGGSISRKSKGKKDGCSHVVITRKNQALFVEMVLA